MLFRSRSNSANGGVNGFRAPEKLHRTIDAAAGMLLDRRRWVARDRVHRYGPEPRGKRQTLRVDVHRVDGERAHLASELDSGHAQPTYSKDGHPVTTTDVRLAKRMERCGRGAHHDRGGFRGDLIRDSYQVARRDDHEVGEATVHLLADHRPMAAELLMTGDAVVAVTAAHEVVHAYTGTGHDAVLMQDGLRCRAGELQRTRDLVSGYQRQWTGL